MKGLLKRPGVVDVRYVALAAFLLLYPLAAIAMRGSASALLIAAGLVALWVEITSPRTSTDTEVRRDVDWSIRATCAAMAVPLIAVFLSEVWHTQMRWSAFDTPSRFLVAVPLFLVLRRVPLRWMRWCDLSFMVAAFAALGIGLWYGRDWGGQRLSSKFLNPIHYGDMALALGMLSVLSLNWWRKDTLMVRVLKVGGLLAGLATSLLSGSRGGWLAIPAILLLVVIVRGRNKSSRWRWLVPVTAVLGLTAVYLVSAPIQARFHELWSDLSQFALGHKDTSVGIRLQIYHAALILTENNPLFGLGAGGFCSNLQALVDAGQMTPMARELGCGEAHNQLLAFTVAYGVLGGLGIIAIHLMPAILCWRYLHSPIAPMRRAGLMGMVFAAAFFVFGLTVEIFTLKQTVSFYAAVMAILAGIAAHACHPSDRIYKR
jgi:O-antigen ligase